jgi:hypothetical protein
MQPRNRHDGDSVPDGSRRNHRLTTGGLKDSRPIARVSKDRNSRGANALACFREFPHAPRDAVDRLIAGADCSCDIAEYYLANCYDQVKSWIADRNAQAER